MKNFTHDRSVYFIYTRPYYLKKSSRTKMYWISEKSSAEPITAIRHPLNHVMLKIMTRKLLKRVLRYDLKIDDVLFDTIVPPNAENKRRRTIVTMYLDIISQ